MRKTKERPVGSLEVFGDAGRCTRTNVGVPSLPLGFAVEIDGVFEID